MALLSEHEPPTCSKQHNYCFVERLLELPPNSLRPSVAASQAELEHHAAARQARAKATYKRPTPYWVNYWPKCLRLAQIGYDMQYDSGGLICTTRHRSVRKYPFL